MSQISSLFNDESMEGVVIGFLGVLFVVAKEWSKREGGGASSVDDTTAKKDERREGDTD